MTAAILSSKKHNWEQRHREAGDGRGRHYRSGIGEAEITRVPAPRLHAGLSERIGDSQFIGLETGWQHHPERAASKNELRLSVPSIITRVGIGCACDDSWFDLS